MRVMSVAGVCERDIDLLVLEEIIASPDFRGFLVSAVNWQPDGLMFAEARRSVTHSSGESDIEIVYSRHQSGDARLLIENKVSAGFQPDQAERYRRRGSNYIETHQCAMFATLLLAPARYLGSGEGTKGFDAVLTYEQLIEWFDAANLGERAAFKKLMLRSAIDRAVLGYQPQADTTVTDFWRGYWRISLDAAPALEMKEPAGKPARSGFIAFSPSGLPVRSSLVHKCNHGYVDLQLRGLADVVNQLARLLQPYLEQDMSLARSGKSASVRIHVPRLSTAGSFEDQKKDVEVGLDAALRLLLWARGVPDAVWERCYAFRAGRRQIDGALSLNDSLHFPTKE